MQALARPRHRRPILPPLPPPPPPHPSSSRFLPPRFSRSIFLSHSGGSQSCSAWALLLAARQPLPAPRVPPWPRTNLGPEAAPFTAVGSRHRRTAPPRQSPAARSDQGRGQRGRSPRCCWRHPSPTLQGGFVGGRQQGRTNACLRLLVGDRGVGEVSLEILEFDLERQSLAVVKLPPGLDVLPLDVDIDSVLEHHDMCTVMRAEGGGLGFLFVPYYTAQAQLWKRNTDCDGVVSWGLTRAIELDKLLSLNLKEIRPIHVLGYAEYNNMLLLRTDFSIFTVQLESLQFKKFPRIGDWSFFHPFESVYTAGHKQQWVMGS